MEAFDEAQRIADARFFTPAWPLVEMCNGRAGRMRSCVATIRGFGKQVMVKKNCIFAKVVRCTEQLLPETSHICTVVCCHR